MFDRFRGVLPKASLEGTHFLIPFIQSPTIYDLRTRPRSITSVTGTKDLQQVNLTLRLLFRPDVDRLAEIHMTRGPDYDERVCRPLVTRCSRRQSRSTRLSSCSPCARR